MARSVFCKLHKFNQKLFSIRRYASQYERLVHAVPRQLALLSDITSVLEF